MEHGGTVLGPAEAAFASGLRAHGGGRDRARRRDLWIPFAFEAASRITAAQSRRRPTKLCVEADEAIPWLVARRLHHAPDDAFRVGLNHAIERVRAQLDPFW